MYNQVQKEKWKYKEMIKENICYNFIINVNYKIPEEKNMEWL